VACIDLEDNVLFDKLPLTQSTSDEESTSTINARNIANDHLGRHFESNS
jgi:hypothetical protein